MSYTKLAELSIEIVEAYQAGDPEGAQELEVTYRNALCAKEMEVEEAYADGDDALAEELGLELDAFLS